jgi:hypothetical protein
VARRDARPLGNFAQSDGAKKLLSKRIVAVEAICPRYRAGVIGPRPNVNHLRGKMRGTVLTPQHRCESDAHQLTYVDVEQLRLDRADDGALIVVEIKFNEALRGGV